MDVKTTLNPIGKVTIVPGLDVVLSGINQAWTALEVTVKNNKAVIVQFMVFSLDTLIVYMVQQNISGPDKKATVIKNMSDLYDSVVSPMIPIWLMPFKPSIKNFVIKVVISHAIDWIVEKYKNQSWSTPVATAI